jgi:hypothetical protein
MAALNDITFFKGEAVQLNFTMDPVVDITGWTITLTIKVNNSDAAAVLTVTPAQIISAAGGQFRLSLTHAQTAALTGNGTYAYDVWRTDSGSEVVLSYGVITVTQDVLY